MDVCVNKFKLIGYGELEISMDGGLPLSLSRSISKTVSQTSTWSHSKQEQDGNSIHVWYFNQLFNYLFMYSSLDYDDISSIAPSQGICQISRYDLVFWMLENNRAICRTKPIGYWWPEQSSRWRIGWSNLFYTNRILLKAIDGWNGMELANGCRSPKSSTSLISKRLSSMIVNLDV